MEADLLRDLGIRQGLVGDDAAELQRSKIFLVVKTGVYDRFLGPPGVACKPGKDSRGGFNSISISTLLNVLGH